MMRIEDSSDHQDYEKWVKMVGEKIGPAVALELEAALENTPLDNCPLIEQHFDQIREIAFWCNVNFEGVMGELQARDDLRDGLMARLMPANPPTVVDLLGEEVGENNRFGGRRVPFAESGEWFQYPYADRPPIFESQGATRWRWDVIIALFLLLAGIGGAIFFVADYFGIIDWLE